MDTICRNTNGSYDCVPDGCEFGYRWNSTFSRCVGELFSFHLLSFNILNYFFFLILREDIDECLENTHKCIAETETCKNLDGSFECEIKCDTGYMYSGFYAACLGKNFMCIFINYQLHALSFKSKNYHGLCNLKYYFPLTQKKTNYISLFKII